MTEISPVDTHLPPQLPRPPQRNKKTRELPNLSNCHSCNRRVNCINPKNRLRTLTSEWRIVLLCNSCHSLVQSSQICSYCLTDLSSLSADLSFECKRCHRRIHRNCVSMFEFCSGNNSGEFSVCFDCWVPKSLENDYYIRVCETRPRKRAKEVVKICGDSTSLESSRVCDSQDKGKGKSLEKTVNEVNVVGQKKIVVALEAKDKAVAKAMAARRVVELVGDGVNLVAVDRDAGNRGSLVVDDDAQLAIQLHRAMNSSPRISRNSCLLNKNCVDLSTVNVNGDSEALYSQAAEKTCVSKAINVGSEATATATATDTLSHREQSGICSAETKQGFVRKTDGSEDEKSKLASNLNDCLITYSRKRQASQDGRSKQESNGLLRMYRRRLSHVERRNAERDLCLKTYRRRLSTKSPCKNELLHDGFNLEHGILAPTLALNHCKEPRVYADAS